MKKRLSSLLLVLALLLALFSGCSGSTPLPATDESVPPATLGENPTQIRSVADLALLAEDPDGSYILRADLDFQGEVWTPVPFFGFFEGGGHTIFNVRIEESGLGSAMGFWSIVDSSGVVQNLHLRDIQVDAGGTQAENIGTIAGICRGAIRNCSATGVISDDRNGSNIYAGALVGSAEENAVVDGVDSISISFENTGSPEPLKMDIFACADVDLQVQTQNCGLVGAWADTAQVSGRWRDRSGGSHRESRELQQRRSKIVDYMYRMGTIRWTPSEELSYISEAGKDNLHYQVFEAGKTYKGLPYNHMHGSLERFQSCLEEDHTVIKTDSSLWQYSTYQGAETGVESYNGFVTYMGNDCSGAVYWAWLQASPAEVNEANGVRVNLTGGMVPNLLNQRQNGVYPVGGYECTDQEETARIYALNGQETMLEALAQCKRGDAVLFYGANGGHARLCAADAVAIRDKNGAIDGERSFLLTHEQGDGLYERSRSKSSWRINYQYTFNDLMNGGSGTGKHYVPITVRALQEGAVLPEPAVDAADVIAPNRGELRSAYRIVSATVTVRRSDTQVLERTVYPCTDESVYECRIGQNYGCFADLEKIFENLEGLHPGEEYSFTLRVLLSTGDSVTVAENMTFTYEP